MPRIRYRGLDQWKYQLMEPYFVKLNFNGGTFKNGFLEVNMHNLEICKGYCWDGPSGPTWDTSCAMRGSLVHDALYQLIRLGVLGRRHRRMADDLFHLMLREDGMGRFRAWYFWRAVRAFGGGAARPRKPVVVKSAP